MIASMIDEGKLPTSMTFKNGKCTESTRKLPNAFNHSKKKYIQIDTFDKLCDQLEKEFEGRDGNGEEDKYFEFLRKHWIVENGISKCEW